MCVKENLHSKHYTQCKELVVILYADSGNSTKLSANYTNGISAQR